MKILQYLNFSLASCYKQLSDSPLCSCGVGRIHKMYLCGVCFSCLEVSYFTGIFLADLVHILISLGNYYACTLPWNNFFLAHLLIGVSTYLSNYCYPVCKFQVFENLPTPIFFIFSRYFLPYQHGLLGDVLLSCFVVNKYVPTHQVNQ